MDWIVQCFTSPPTQYRLYGRRFLQVKRPNQQYQSPEGDEYLENGNRYDKSYNYNPPNSDVYPIGNVTFSQGR